jgi:(2Fe-2S) ferredoxin
MIDIYRYGAMGDSKKKLLVCVKGKSCHKKDSPDLYDCLKAAIAGCRLDNYYKVKKVDCFGLCQYSPVVKVVPDGAIYGRIGAVDVVKIALRHMKKRKPIKKLAIGKKKRK